MGEGAKAKREPRRRNNEEYQPERRLFKDAERKARKRPEKKTREENRREKESGEKESGEKESGSAFIWRKTREAEGRMSPPPPKESRLTRVDGSPKGDSRGSLTRVESLARLGSTG